MWWARPQHPTPIRDVVLGRDFVVEPRFQCGPSEPTRGFPQGFLSWTSDGAHIVFSHYNVVWKVDKGATQLQNVLDANPERPSFPGQAFFVYWFHADVSPDNAWLVYTSCQYPTEYEQVGISQTDAEALLARVGPEWYERGKYQYEISLSGLDGGDQQRLTHNLRLDHYPAWSPSGDRIAYISSVEKSEGRFIVSDFDMRLDKLGLYTMSADGSNVQQAATRLGSIALASPMWSPDSQQLAVVVNEGDKFLQDRQALHIAQSDGSEVTRIGETAAVSPAWSPDGGRLAFVDSDGQIIYTVRPDGTDWRELWRGDNDAYSRVSQVLWSPDGSAVLLVLADSALTLGPNGHNLRRVLDWQPRYYATTRAAWSPDGSRIAFYNPSEGILTIARDGTEPRQLLEVHDRKLLRLPIEDIKE